MEERLRTVLDDKRAIELAEIFKAMSAPTRVKILYALEVGEQAVSELSSSLGMSDSAISHHLRILRALRLVKYRREGRMIYYSLDDDHISGLFRQGLEHVAETWPEGED